MIGRISVAAISLCIGACASSGPESASPTMATSPAAVEPVAVNEASAQSADELTELDAPGVETTASAELARDPNEVVCRRERPTGSNISRRVCRTVAEIEARAEEDQAALRQMRAIRSGSQQDMQGGN